MNERLVDITTPLGEDLWFRQMTGTEALSTLFEYDVTFHSGKPNLKAKAILGLSVTLKVQTQDEGVRYFNGIVTRFAAGGREGIHYVYTAKLRPSLWIASRRSDCKIFQEMTALEMIDEVLKPYGFDKVVKAMKPYRKWEYCVQYQETDLNFVMRMMEHEGIYFYFEHTDGNHILTLMDDVHSHPQVPERPTIIYSGVDAATVESEEHFDSWHLREEVDPGEYETNDYDFKKPSANLLTNKSKVMAHAQAGKQRFAWPGGYVDHNEGDVYANIRMEALVAEQERAQGHCSVRTIATGYLFTLDQCPIRDQNREYLVVAATYFFRNNARMSAGSGEGDATWGITVTSQPTSNPYRPQRLTPKPLTHGPQTAVVVGPAGEEIYTDEYGRVKVHFFWDRHDKRDENSSCWIRVSHPWAGEKWGFIHIPRIGQEVIVDFIGGDPDYPMITGRVYNAEKMPPYDLPANKTASGIKSRSTKGGSPTDFNEIRMEDKKGEEELYLHAQKNYNTVVELDESRTVGQNRQTRIEKDDSRFVKGTDTHVVVLSQTNQIDKDQTTKVKENQTFEVKLDQTITVGGKRTMNVTKDLNEEVHGSHFESVTKNHSLTVSGNQYNTVEGEQTNKAKKRDTIITGDDTTTITGKTTLMSPLGYSVNAGTSYGETCVDRSAMVYKSDETKVLLSQTETIGVSRSTKVGVDDTTNVLGKKSTTVGLQTSLTTGTLSVTSGTISVTGAAVTINALSVTINAPMITINGMVMINGMLQVKGLTNFIGLSTVVGTLISTNVTPATYTPSLGNLV